MKKGIIAVLLLSMVLPVKSQSYTAAQRTNIEQKLNSYRNDEVTGFINEALQLFNNGHTPSGQVLTGAYALGVVYVMDQSADCSGSACSNPAVDAAAFESGYSKMGMMRIRRGENDAKRPLPEYVWMYQSGRVKNSTYSTKYILEYLGNKISMYNYTDNGKECVIGKNTFVRQNGNDLVAISITADYSRINIYRFTLDAADSSAAQRASIPEKSTASTSRPMQKVYEVEKTATTPASQTTRKPVAQKEYLVEPDASDAAVVQQAYAAESEYDKTLADMLQQIINNRSLTMYYKSDDIYIVNSGLFPEYLVVKYKGNQVKIQSVPAPGKREYVKFVSTTYDGKNSHDTEFKFSMPLHGVGGKAIFKHTGSRWFLSEVVVVAE